VAGIEAQELAMTRSNPYDVGLDRNPANFVPLSPLSFIERTASVFPDRVALIYGTRRQSWSQTYRRCRRLGSALAARGIGRGDTVAAMLPNVPAMFEAHFGVAMSGAVLNTLNTRLDAEAIAFMLQHGGARMLLTDREFSPVVEKALALFEGERPLVVEVQDPQAPAGRELGEIDYESLLASGDPDFAWQLPADEWEAITLNYTSGTTGNPKGALQAHRTLLGHLPGVEMSHNLLPRQDDLMWTPADWAWIGGLLDLLFAAWHHGIPVVAHRFEKFHPEAAFELMAKHKVRNAFLPPTALKMMRSVPRAKARWNLELRSIASGGESLGVELLQWGHETFGLNINEFYGQTECNMVLSSCAALFSAKPGAIGKAAPGHQVDIVDDTEEVSEEPLGWRHAREVLSFLRKRGAKVASLQRGIEGEWAALNSDAETSLVEGSETSRDEDIVSVRSRETG